MIQERKTDFADALLEDLGKPPAETYSSELPLILQRTLESAAKLEEWAAPEAKVSPKLQAWKPTINKAPKGVVLIISPWNYPIFLTFQPLIGALAAGCCAVVKPSEFAPSFSGLLAKLLPEYLDNNAYRVVNGAIPEITKVLELQWDYIFYTGNGKVARIIAAAAAKHLTPASLELGGKSPVIIDPEIDLNLAAKRIINAKLKNSGQVCVAPDYVLIPEGIQDEFIGALKEHYIAFFGEPGGAINSTSYGSIVNSVHLTRLKNLLKGTKGEVVFGGTTDDARKRFDLTIVKNVTGEDSLMQEEIFGPILPVIPVKSIDEAIDFVNARDHPLVLYPFTHNPDLQQRIINETTSGGLAFNDCIVQLAVPELPFCGVGESGYGAQVMYYSYAAFTHFRSTTDVPVEFEQYFQSRYPPYSEETVKGMAEQLMVPIPPLESVPKL